MTATLAAVGRPPLVKGEDGWLERVELITPAMCGHNSLFMGQLGDWTWDAVGVSCQMNPYAAVDPEGNPVYLSFAYFRVKASEGLSAEQLTFGDRLRIRSKVLSCGGDSVLTLHQVNRDTGDTRAAGCGVDGFFRYDTPRSIHVENFNRWIQRSGHDTNHGLRRATPVGFQLDNLEQVPDEHTPRRVWSQARKNASFRQHSDPAPEAELALTYEVSASRDLNGVGLLYFASYFSIVDWAVLSMWRGLGRSASSFLRRRVLDRQICYIANANADDALDIEVTTHHDAEGLDVVDTTLRHQDGSLLAVARQRIRHIDGA
ncbi:biosynthesis cluster domain-containing protein [Kibdelosporangium aridum]|uniref:Biosynthesis cluster domain-containing protein n=1 Tax=Kibdelosporangium aridum TaxID=2030 RepID=A0A428Z4V3_KIBAR|nr:biosynthesis cluster domain-containing protein [Kibdelosporangium aridum]RSM81625.1 biosynthesis cluster domain-containing protein [Kibdelosporangium aridum]